jgi:preprotein translocase subunit SecA
MLRTIDSQWVQHLTGMENLRQGIGLHAFGQRDPLVMFKHEGHQMFQNLLEHMQHDIVHTVFRVGLMSQPVTRRVQSNQSIETPISAVATREKQAQATTINSNKVGRNDPCHCGSGKKYKRCHGV